LARELEIGVIAEGVETQEQCDVTSASVSSPKIQRAYCAPADSPCCPASPNDRPWSLTQPPASIHTRVYQLKTVT
jgi:hypothetical protein